MGQISVAPAIGAKMASLGVAEYDESLVVTIVESEKAHECITGRRD